LNEGINELVEELKYLNIQGEEIGYFRQTVITSELAPVKQKRSFNVLIPM